GTDKISMNAEGYCVEITLSSWLCGIYNYVVYMGTRESVPDRRGYDRTKEDAEVFSSMITDEDTEHSNYRNLYLELQLSYERPKDTQRIIIPWDVLQKTVKVRTVGQPVPINADHQVRFDLVFKQGPRKATKTHG